MRDALCAAPDSSSAIAEACASVLSRTSARIPSGRRSLAPGGTGVVRRSASTTARKLASSTPASGCRRRSQTPAGRLRCYQAPPIPAGAAGEPGDPPPATAQTAQNPDWLARGEVVAVPEAHQHHRRPCPSPPQSLVKSRALHPLSWSQVDVARESSRCEQEVILRGILGDPSHPRIAHREKITQSTRCSRRCSRDPLGRPGSAEPAKAGVVRETARGQSAGSDDARVRSPDRRAFGLDRAPSGAPGRRRALPQRWPGSGTAGLGGRAPAARYG